MKFLFVTLFPEQIEQAASHSILQRAASKGLIEVSCINPRDFTHDVHRTVDDSPFGGGAGMAPMRSHIFNLFHTMHTDRKVTFWYGARALQEAPYVDEFNKIQEENPNFHWTLALDRPDPVADAAGVAYKPGFVHQVIFENYLKNHENPEDIEYYLCGPPMMISAVTKMLYDLGVPDENVMYDNFGG